ncbi:polyketide cyclase [Lentzea sp. NBRC 105346]|uniref:SRPBCC family protein n=1 Tax=Lentzea sp. NBRC 105346 TaxID=3032205 RepID=UPI0024A38698|nr:SRPBCC family protein [Lentzea sp. NBRC 105346]GLZ29361.1 polyketide cyclase [Lentzea sp. NBRC 105346]
MAINTYCFRSEWHVNASPGSVFDVLADIGSYPVWWPEVKQAIRVHDECAELRCRSVLPFDLVFRASHSAEDRQAGLLRADLEGDLEGFASWELTGRDGGTDVLFDQLVEARKPLLRKAALVAKPLLRANHEMMMRSGERGLREYLAVRTAS